MGFWREVLLFRSDRALSFLLVSIGLLQFVVYPFIEPQGVGKYFIDVFFTFILVSATLTLEGRWRRVALGVVVLTLATNVLTYSMATRELFIANTVLVSIFLFFTTVAILARVFASGPVTTYRVQGAVAVYLLIGMFFTGCYALLAMTTPNAFDLAGVSVTGEWTRENYGLLMREFGYFSFVTLTTVGYGDITPVDLAAKNLAVIQGLLGQLYPAILLARLVSLEVSSAN